MSLDPPPGDRRLYHSRVGARLFVASLAVVSGGLPGIG
jgi:hypothetical protein